MGSGKRSNDGLSEDSDLFPKWETGTNVARTIPQPEKNVNIFFN
jgi:hypothetical protein